jgi:transposase
MALRLREVTPDEARELRQRAHSRTEAARMVERAKLIWLTGQGHFAPAVAKRLGIADVTVRKWVARCNMMGLAGLADQPRTGRPPTYTIAEVGEVIATSLTPPMALNLPFASWTLDRLTTYLHERPMEAGGPLPISRSQIDRIVSDEGLRWRTQETWFGERVDPEFAEKRGPLRNSGRHHLRGVS